MIARPHTLLVRLSYLFIGLTALLPRLLDLGGFITDDEANFWLRRSETFLDALRSGDFAATAIAVHPGVTTMWLGSVGIILRRTLRDWELVPEISFPLLLLLMRLPVVLVHMAGILLGYWLLRRLFAPGVAFVGALLWATDPFIIGYSRLLHVDALAATFATLSLLALCLCCAHSHPCWHPSLIASGSFAALAVLSKSPALALLPVVVVVVFWRYFTRHSPCTFRYSPFAMVLVWGAAFGLTILLVWPAVWADPQRVYELLRFGVESEGAEPHMTGNFFLGRPTDVPGPLFYPVALALRMTPWTLAGVLLLGICPGMQVVQRERRDYQAIAVLAAFSILFIVAMSLFPKKFNRYLLLVFPSVTILAAVSLVWCGQWLTRVAGWRATWLSGGLLVICASMAIINAAWWHPYYLTAFNQALGSAPAGARTFSVGWGEGLEQVAAWLNQQPDITRRVTAADRTLALNPYLKHGAQATSPDDGILPERSGYVVVYIYQAQGTVFPPFDQFYGRAPPVHVVRIHGVEYAWIYQVPPPVTHALPADFGSVLHLRGFECEESAQPGAALACTLFWQTRAAPATDYWLFAHLIGADGVRYAQVDLPYATGAWQVNRFISTELPIALPADRSPGRYALVVGLYDPANDQRLPLTVLAPDHLEGAGAYGADALYLTSIEVE